MSTEREAHGGIGEAIVWTIKQTAWKLQISERKLFDLRRDGQLEPVKIGGAVRYRPSDVEAYVNRLSGGPG